MAYRSTESAAPYLYEQQGRRDKGMRDLLNMFMMSKQIQEQRGLGQAEREAQERHMLAQEDLWGAQAEKVRRPEAGGSVPQWQFRLGFAEELLKHNIIDQTQFNKYLLEGTLDKDISEYQQLLIQEKKVKQRRDIFDDAIKAFEGRQKHLEQPMSLGEYVMLNQEGVAPSLDMDAKKITNIGLGLSELKRLKGLLETGELSDEDFAKALNIYSQMKSIEERGPFWEEGRDEADIKGSYGLPLEVQDWLRKNPDKTYAEALQGYKEWKEQQIK